MNLFDQTQRSRRKENEAKGAYGITDNWSQFLVGFFRPVRQHPPDDGRLSEWATGWGGDDDGWATGWGGVSALKVNVDTRRSFAQHGGVQRSRRRRRI